MFAPFHLIEAPPSGKLPWSSFYSSLYSDQEQNLIHGTFLESVMRDWCKTRTGKSVESIPCENSEKRRGKWIERSMWRVAFDHDESRWSKSDQLHPCSPPRIAGVSSWTCHNVRNRKAHFSYFRAFYPSATLPHLPYGPFFHQEHIQPLAAESLSLFRFSNQVGLLCLVRVVNSNEISTRKYCNDTDGCRILTKRN